MNTYAKTPNQTMANQMQQWIKKDIMTKVGFLEDRSLAELQKILSWTLSGNMAGWAVR